MKRISSSNVIGLVALIAVTALVGLAASRVSAQEDLVAHLTTQLSERGVPLKSLEITGRAPLRLEAVLQSESNSDSVAPADPLFGNLVQREVALANQRLGAGIASIRITTLNAAGRAILWADEPVRALDENLSAGADGLTHTQVADLFRSRFPLEGVALREILVQEDGDGARVLDVTLGVTDVETGDEVARGFAHKLRQMVDVLNAQERTAIAKYDVEIRDAHGDLLLSYGRDVLLSHEYGWFSDPSLYWWVRGG